MDEKQLKTKKKKIWQKWCAEHRVHVFDDRVVIGNMKNGKMVWDKEENESGVYYVIRYNPVDRRECKKEFSYPEALSQMVLDIIHSTGFVIEHKSDRKQVLRDVILAAWRELRRIELEEMRLGVANICYDSKEQFSEIIEAVDHATQSKLSED